MIPTVAGWLMLLLFGYVSYHYATPWPFVGFVLFCLACAAAHRYILWRSKDIH